MLFISLLLLVANVFGVVGDVDDENDDDDDITAPEQILDSLFLHSVRPHWTLMDSLDPTPHDVVELETSRAEMDDHSSLSDIIMFIVVWKNYSF